MKKVAIVVLLLFAPFSVSTQAQVLRPDSPPDAERYIVRPGIVMTIALAKNGQPCEMVIEPRHSLLSTDAPSKLMSSDEIDEILDEVLPLSQRGKLLQDIMFTSSCNAIRHTDYEKVTINRSITCSSEVESGESPVQIRFKTSQCQ